MTMACRPAGMSDEESSDEDEFSFYHEEPKTRTCNRLLKQNEISATVANTKSKAIPKEETSNDEQESQFRALSACMSGNLEIIQEYIDAGHNTNEFLHTGWTLLLYGASSVLPDVIELLIKFGARPNKSKDGYTPLMAVCDSKQGSEEQCLRCIQILIQAKANPNAHNKEMKTPLMFACKSREAGVVAELLKHVKNIDATDNDGRTALHYAILAKKLETIKILLKNNASTIIKDRRDMNARDIANTKGFDKILELLNFENDCDVNDYCESTRRDTWSDMFPALSNDTSDLIHCDIADILYGMGLESYKPLFKGIDLKTFLKLTDEDLLKLGMDIALHRKQFVDNLFKFHTKRWSIHSIGSVKKLLPYTLFDGVALLGNAARQIGVIGSSFQFIKNGLRRASTKGTSLSQVQRAKYTEELQKTEKTLMLLKKDLRQVMILAKKVEKDNCDIIPAAYIGKKEAKYNWTIILSVMLMTGMYLSKASFVQKLWNS